MSTLVVPIHVDALVVEHGREVLGPSTNFDVMPWFDGARDRYPSTPNVSGAVTPEPFADGGLWLEPGVHLHWALPDGLTRGSTRRTAERSVNIGELWFPPAPNRWLVLDDVVKRWWMIESDFVHPVEARPRRSIAYPRTAPADGRPWIHLGREQPAAIGAPWIESSSNNPSNYLPGIDAPLTALGSRDPLFAALYANSRSVFGTLDAIDPEAEARPVTEEWASGDHSYIVFGWYSPQVTDPLAAMSADRATWHDRDIVGRLNVQRLLDELDPYPEDHVPTADDIVSMQRLTLGDRFGWHVDADAGVEFPDSSGFVGRVDVRAGQPSTSHAGVTDAPIVIGNTATEAVATLVAHDQGDPTIEHQLEAAAWGPVADHHALDIEAKFDEFRHGRRFRESGRQRVWTARAARPLDAGPALEGANTVGTDDGAQGDIDLPPDLAHELNVLNELQQTYEVGLNHIDGLRRQLFSDWYRYMLVAYPAGELDDPEVDIDALQRLISESSLPAVRDAVDELGSIDFARAEDVGGWSVTHQGDGTHAAVLAARLDKMLGLLTDHNRARPSGRHVELALTPGPRFWRPADPVVAMRYPGEAPRRHGHDGRARTDGLLACGVCGNFQTLTVDRPPYEMLSAWNTLMAGDVFKSVQGNERWSPVVLEWQAEVEATLTGSNQHDPPGRYDTDFISANYDVTPGFADFAAHPAEGRQLAPATEYVSGRSVLVSDVGALVAERLANAVDRIEAAAADPVEGIARPTVPRAIATARSWLSEHGDQVVAATLGGFHDALLMGTPQQQLPIADPIGFPHQQELATQVTAALGGAHFDAPQPDDPFHPLRTGELVLQRVRLVDTFGQTVEWRPISTPVSDAFRPSISPASLRGPDRHNEERRCLLTPRISQGAMLDMRWLSADDGTVESNDHPASTPVCGWLLPNALDGVLQVHDGAGVLIGSIDEDGVWQAAPGALRPVVVPEDIPNPHLSQVVRWVVRSGEPPMRIVALQATIEAGLEAIDPADYAQHPSRSLLVGQPVAVVRARIALTLQGDPATDQSWGSLRRRLLGDPPDDHGAPAVRFPIRIGDGRQLNDGLVGYWLEDDGELGDTVQSAANVFGLEAGHDNASALWRSTVDPPTELTMLVDPRAPVHALCPIQPTQTISIPADHFADVLAKMRVVFATMPVLTPAASVTVPLPNESGYGWSWLQRERSGWTEIPEHPTVYIDDLERAFPGRGTTMWHDLVTRGVIVSDSAAAQGGRLRLPKPSDPSAPGSSDASAETIEPELLRALLTIARSVRPMTVGATFGTPTVIREGWLQLRPVQAEGGTAERSDS